MCLYNLRLWAPHHGNFVNNGINTADRQPTGKVKRIYQYIKFGWSECLEGKRHVSFCALYEFCYFLVLS